MGSCRLQELSLSLLGAGGSEGDFSRPWKISNLLFGKSILVTALFLSSGRCISLYG